MIDHSRIQELRTEIGDEDLTFIVSVYLEEARRTLDGLSGGLSQDDRARTVHFLRSGALNIGLRGIATLAGRLENGSTMPLALCAGQLHAALDQTMAELDGALTC